MMLNKKSIIVIIIIVAVLSVAGYFSYYFYFQKIVENKKEQMGDEIRPPRGPMTKEEILQKLADLGTKEEIPMEIKFKTLDKLSDIKSPASKKTTDEERKKILQALSNLK